jgi:hypothetical protein
VVTRIDNKLEDHLKAKKNATKFGYLNSNKRSLLGLMCGDKSSPMNCLTQ